MNIIKSNPEYRRKWDANQEETKTELARAYFKVALTLTKNLNLQSTQERYEDQTDFVEKLGFRSNQDHYLTLTLRDDDELDEMMLCYSLTSVPGEEKFQRCPGREDNKFRRDPFYVPQRT